MAALLGWVAAGLTAAGWMRAVLRGRLRAELIVRACHEVRGPLTAASLALHALTRSNGLATPAAVERELARAVVALQDVAAAGRGRRVRDRPEPVDLRELLALQAATWGPVARSLGTDLVVRGRGVDATVRADRVRLARATANLIANALEHGEGPVTVGATDHGDRVRIEVGYGLVKMVDTSKGGDLLDRISMIRRQIAMDLGIIVPPCRIRDNIQLGANDYIVKIKGQAVAKGETYPQQFLAMDNGVSKVFEPVERRLLDDGFGEAGRCHASGPIHTFTASSARR